MGVIFFIILIVSQRMVLPELSHLAKAFSCFAVLTSVMRWQSGSRTMNL